MEGNGTAAFSSHLMNGENAKRSKKKNMKQHHRVYGSRSSFDMGAKSFPLGFGLCTCISCLSRERNFSDSSLDYNHLRSFWPRNNMEDEWLLPQLRYNDNRLKL